MAYQQLIPGFDVLMRFYMVSRSPCVSGKLAMLIPEHRSVSPTSLAFSRETLFFFGLLFLQNAHSYHLP